jgi:hypothetical protein
VTHDSGIDAEHLAHELRREDHLGRSGGDDPSGAHDVHRRAVRRRDVEVVEGYQGRHPELAEISSW